MADLPRMPAATTASLLDFLAADAEFRQRVDWEVVTRAGRDSWRDCHQLWEAGAVRAEDLANAIATWREIPRADAAAMRRQDHPLDGFSVRFLREAWIWPYSTAQGAVVAIADPCRHADIEAALIAAGMDAALAIAAFDELASCFERQAGMRGALAEPQAGEPGAGDIDRAEDMASTEPVVRAVEELLEDAAGMSATDIHIEPGERETGVRLRVDGMLKPWRSMAKGSARAVISRVKILAGLDIAETRLPQDGRARAMISASEVDLRVATMPTLHGEAAVIRILPKNARALDLSRLGMAPRDLVALKEALNEPHGLVVVCGPTGSGKTTTLAAGISLLNSTERKIMTVEDPIEYQIPGVHQTQIKPAIGLTFESVLRSFLRHDPDVLMVGEMRNRETAAVGVQAALTGHLVLTTLHTNSAVDSVIRLADLGVDDFLIASVLRCVVGQRLVRRLCERCKRPGATLPGHARALVGADALPGGRQHFEAAGCDACGHTGYRGRVGVFEVLRIDDEIRALLKDRMIQAEITACARRSGMRTLLEDAIDKVFDGATSFEEVFRTVAAGNSG